MSEMLSKMFLFYATPVVCLYLLPGYFIFSSIMGLLLGTCIAFYVVIGDLGPAILSKMFNMEVKIPFGTFQYYKLLLHTVFFQNCFFFLATHLYPSLIIILGSIFFLHQIVQGSLPNHHS